MCYCSSAFLAGCVKSRDGAAELRRRLVNQSCSGHCVRLPCFVLSNVTASDWPVWNSVELGQHAKEDGLVVLSSCVLSCDISKFMTCVSAPLSRFSHT